MVGQDTMSLLILSPHVHHKQVLSVSFLLVIVIFFFSNKEKCTRQVH